MRFSPEAESASSSRRRSSMETRADSFWSPSRGPTSYKVTREGSMTSAAHPDVAAHPLGDRPGGGSRREDLADAQLLQLGNVRVRDDAAAEDHHVVRSLVLEEVDHRGKEGHVGAGHNGESDAVHVFLDRGSDDHLRRLVQAGVDDLEAFVPKGPRDDLRSAI